MIRDDYIMRQIQMLAQIITRLVGLRREALHDVALQESDASLHHLLGMEEDWLPGWRPRISSPSGARGNARHAQARGALLAALFEERATNLLALGREDDAHESRVQALRSSWRCNRAPMIRRFPSTSAPRGLDRDIQAGDLPPAWRSLLLRALEKAGEPSPTRKICCSRCRRSIREDAEVLSWGTSFYARLESKSDAELDAGNLPRAEIAAGRRALHARRSAPS